LERGVQSLRLGADGLNLFAPFRSAMRGERDLNG
jgi:hypothetical protein